jgi:NAD(P) transhydrogenase subunit alpha
MAGLTPQEAAERAQAAAEQALQAAESAQAFADAAALAVESGAQAVGAGGAIDPFVFRFAIFVLAIFVGYYVVWAVTPALHTPLMSVTNAVSSVIIVGAVLAVGVDAVAAMDVSAGWTAKILGFFALMLASVNIFGGFLVTQRMLAMYRKKS